jgi:hypothetical protein
MKEIPCTVACFEAGGHLLTDSTQQEKRNPCGKSHKKMAFAN